MSFKPRNANATSSATFDRTDMKFPVPKAGARPARISLIVDLGTQERPDFEDQSTGETRPQKPVQQIVIYADLTHDVVDYGSNIGMQPYRLCLNKSFMGDTTGANFVATPPKDGNGKIVQGKPWGWHPQSLMSKLARALEMPELIESMDIEQMLGMPFIAQVEVKETEGKNKDDEGNPIIYKNVNYKQASPVPMVEDDDGNEKPMKVKPLTSPPMLITFDTATVEQVKYLRKNIINKIKLSKDYAGSQIEKAIQQFESQNAQEGTSEGHSESKKEEPKQVAKEAPKKASKKVVEPVEYEEDDDIPF